MKRVFLKNISLNRFHFITKLSLIAVFTIVTFSCSNNDEQPPMTSGISKEIRDLMYYKGDKNAPVVLINIQGGPDRVLNTEEVDFIFKNFNTTDVFTVNVHQKQTLNSNILDNDDITLGLAVSYNAESIEILYKVISYFKDEGKKVYILGIGFGAFMAQELIAKKGINVADRYLIIGGRLDVNDIMWQGYAEGRYGSFENGVNPVLNQNPDRNVTDRNLARIAAAIAMNRYTKLLNSFDDLSNITYVYGANDEAVGRLANEEVQFLESKNVNIITGSGDHDATINDFFKQGFSEAFGIE